MTLEPSTMPTSLSLTLSIKPSSKMAITSASGAINSISMTTRVVLMTYSSWADFFSQSFRNADRAERGIVCPPMLQERRNSGHSESAASVPQGDMVNGLTGIWQCVRTVGRYCFYDIERPVNHGFAEGDFRVGSVIRRSASMLSGHFLTFFIVT